MANQIKVTDKLAAVALDIFKGASFVAQNSTRSYDSEFTGSTKIGDSVRVKIPSRYALQTGNNRTTPQAIEQQSRTLQLTQNKYVSLNLTSQELAVFTGTDAAAQTELLEQPIANLARYVDTYCFALMAAGALSVIKKVSATEVSYKDITNLNARLAEQLAPSERLLAASPADLASIMQSQVSLLNPNKEISDAYREGQAGAGLGFSKWFESMSTGTQLIGTCATGTATSAAVTVEGSNAIAVAAITGTLKAGQAITIPGVYAIDPQTLTGIPRLATWIIAADVATTGTAITFTQPFYTIAGSLTLANCSALPATGQTFNIVEVADAGKSAYNVLGWTKKSFALAFMDQPDDLPGAEARSMSEGGVSVRIIKQYQGRSNALDLIADVQFGGLVTRPEWIGLSRGVAS